jgi:hypothetical protein
VDSASRYDSIKYTQDPTRHNILKLIEPSTTDRHAQRERTCSADSCTVIRTNKPVQVYHLVVPGSYFCQPRYLLASLPPSLPSRSLAGISVAHKKRDPQDAQNCIWTCICLAGTCDRWAGVYLCTCRCTCRCTFLLSIWDRSAHPLARTDLIRRACEPSLR